MLVETIRKIDLIEREIDRVASELSESPKSSRLRITLKSLDKLHAQLNSEFLDACANSGMDVCSYRLMYPTAVPRLVSGIADILGNFQNLVSLIYESFQKGEPRKTSRISLESLSQSSLEFGYSFSGSLGFMLTVPNERMLSEAFDSNMDSTISTVNEMTRIKNAEGFHAIAQKIGTAPVKAFYDWARDHAKNGYSVDIKWHRGEEVRSETIVQLPEWSDLTEILTAETEKTATISMRGELVGIDVKLRTFHIFSEDTGEFRGKLGSDFVLPDEGDELRVPAFYNASMLVKTTINYSRAEEKPEYILLSISA